MNILLLDSSFDLLQLALYQDFNVDFNSANLLSLLKEKEGVAVSQQTVNPLYPKIFYAANADKISKGEQAITVLDHLLKSAQCTLADIDVVAFNRGPGSFVGTRIATSIVQALVSANEELKVLSLSSLRMVAEQGLMLKSLSPSLVSRVVKNSETTSFIVALDANMREAYACHYLYKNSNNLFEEVAREQLLTIAQMEDLSTYSTLPAEQRTAFLDSHPELAPLNLNPQHPVLLLGNAWAKYVPEHSQDLFSLLKNFENLANNNNQDDIANYEEKTDPLTTGNCELYLANLINLDSKQPLSNAVALPDFRFLPDYLAFLVKQAKYTNHFAIEPTYVRNNIAY